MKQSEEHAQGNRRNNLGSVIMRKMCLRDAMMIVILMVKAMGTHKKVVGIVCHEALVKENMSAIAKPQNLALQVYSARRESIPVHARWVTRP